MFFFDLHQRHSTFVAAKENAEKAAEESEFAVPSVREEEGEGGEEASEEAPEEQEDREGDADRDEEQEEEGETGEEQDEGEAEADAALRRAAVADIQASVAEAVGINDFHAPAAPARRHRLRGAHAGHAGHGHKHKRK